MNETPRSYFEAMYAKEADPWGFETRDYEHRKYALTIAALPRTRYARIFEPGCSVGVLTSALADRCDELVAYEPIARAAACARLRNAETKTVTIEERAIPSAWPSGRFDLIVLSEILYYFDEAGVARLLECVHDSLETQGQVVAVHYRGATDYPITGDRAHALLDACALLKPMARYQEDLFRLDVLERSSS